MFGFLQQSGRDDAVYISQGFGVRTTNLVPVRLTAEPDPLLIPPMRKKLVTVTAHGELTVSSRWVHGELTVTKMVTASRDWAVTWAVIELWPSRDWTVIAVIELWPRRDWAVTSSWLSCDLAVTELWPSLAVTEPWSLGPGAVTTVVTVNSRWTHGDHLFSHGHW